MFYIDTQTKYVIDDEVLTLENDELIPAKVSDVSSLTMEGNSDIGYIYSSLFNACMSLMSCCSYYLLNLFC